MYKHLLMSLCSYFLFSPIMIPFYLHKVVVKDCLISMQTVIIYAIHKHDVGSYPK